MITMALQVQAVIIGWHIYQLEKSAFLLGMIGLTEAIPAIAGALIAGPLVDQGRPARIFRSSIAMMVANMTFAMLIVIAAAQGSLTHQTELFLLFSCIFISGAARAFFSPATFSLIPQILDRSLIPQAAALSSSSFTLAQILGPAIGGLCFAELGLGLTFAVPLALAVGSLASLFFWPSSLFDIGVPPHIQRKESVLVSMQAGWIFLWNHKVLLSIMSLDMFSVLFGGAVAVLPVFADQVFHVGASGLGFLRAAPAIGAALSTLFLSIKPFQHATGNKLMLAIGAFGVSMIGFGLCTNFWWALVLLFLSGAFDGVNMVLRGTISQLLTPDGMRGRVSSLSSVFITSSNEIGAFESGIAAAAMGLIPSVIFGGVMTLVIVIFVKLKVPHLSATRIAIREKKV